jgi:broad specificity phosphatase PhoE
LTASARRSDPDGHSFSLILTSPLQRAIRTAELAGVTPDAIDPDLVEWDYGAWEGRTTTEIREELQDSQWTIWNAPIPTGATPGEQPSDVGVRAQRVVSDIIDAALANELMLSTLANEPMEPMDSAEPTEPMERIELRDPIDSRDPEEPMLQREVGSDM